MDGDGESKDIYKYELIGENYFYKDVPSGKKFKFNQDSQSWEEVTTNISDTNIEEQQKNLNKSETTLETEKNENIVDQTGVTTDEEGRQYYYAEGLYLCRDVQGNVFYMEDDAWKPWNERIVNEKLSDATNAKWQYFKNGETFYRDRSTNKVYKLNKETNEWEIYQRKRRKRQKHPDEEFDTDDEYESFSEEEQESDGKIPPGFNNDPNITFNDGIYLKNDTSDNTKYEWDPNRKAWFPKLDEDFMATYQLSYGFNPDGTKNENPLKFDDDEEEDMNDKVEKNKDLKDEKRKPGWFEMDDSHNTKVYVSNLPTELTEQQFVDFMQKCGLVLLDLQTQKHKIKMYTDSNGIFKGDALCTYIKIESVDLALQILDGYKYDNNVVKVERAKFTLKGDYNPDLKPKKKKKKDLDKLQKKQQKLFDWRPDPLRGQRQKHENVVIIRNVFDHKEFEEAAERILTHKEGIRNQAISFGEVKKVELFDRHPEGVVKITFTEFEAADMCAATLDNRLYLKRRLVVKTWDGSEKFLIEETEQERQERIRKWEEFLEGRKK